MTRRHDIDALRALAFALLILYHWGMLYVFDWGWHIKSTHTYEWLQLPMLVVNRWRMSLIFLISGASSAFLLTRETAGRFLGKRTWRLLLPLLFGMLVIVPVQPYVQGIGTGFVKPGYLEFLERYYQFRPWPKGAFDGDRFGVTWNHLWYLFYLWAYTLLLTVVLPLLRSRAGVVLQRALTGLRGWALLLLPALPIVIETLALQGRFDDNADFIHDGYRNVLYFTMFLYGFCFARDGAVWDELARLRGRALALACSLCVVYVAYAKSLPDDSDTTMKCIAWTLRSLYVWAALATVLGWSKALLDRPFRWLPWANEAVFPWYVLHQSLIVLGAYWLIPLRLPAPVEALAVLAFTVGGCWLGFALVRRVAFLRPLFGMKRAAGIRARRLVPAPGAPAPDVC